MPSILKSLVAPTAAFLRRFHRDRGGQIATIFAITSLVLVLATGAGVDLSRAYVARQQLSNAATLTCQYSARPMVVSMVSRNASGPTDYVSSVNNYAKTFVSGQSPYLKQTNAAPFSYTQGGASSVTMNAAVPTFFMGMVGIATLPVGATSQCTNGVPQVDDTAPQVVFSESFENSQCNAYCWSIFPPNGVPNAFISTPVNVPPSNYGYTGKTGTQWTVTGYCIEIDAVGLLKSTVPDGSYSAELDCDNHSGSKGNSSISTKSYLTAGVYELRYNYSGRVGYPNYSPAVICGTTASDVAWANDTNSTRGPALRTNQINVYLDQDSTGSPPTHTTMDGTQQLAGGNLIDVCVNSDDWAERSIKITVSTAGYYWTSFAADGLNDSYGGQIDDLRLCRTSCTGAVDDNFPPAWKTKPILFEDTFESPTYTQDPFTTSAHAKGGNLANSYGTSGSASGWPQQSTSGWAVAPYNELNFWMQGATQGNQYFSLQGWNGFSTGTDPLNRSVARPFLLDPGYYSISFYYASLLNFAYDFVYSNTYFPICTAYPTSAPSSTAYGQKHGRQYPDTNSGTLYTQYLSTNFMNVYMAHGALVSTPSTNTTLGGPPSYTNPDGTVTTTPATPLDNGSNFTTYNAAAVNPILDTCFYSGNYAWTPQTINVQITKPGYYWLAFSALGDPLTGLGAGPGLDDVKITALNSPYGSVPSTYKTLPTPGPAPGSTISYTGFSIIADPLKP